MSKNVICLGYVAQSGRNMVRHWAPNTLGLTELFREQYSTDLIGLKESEHPTSCSNTRPELYADSGCNSVRLVRWGNNASFRTILTLSPSTHVGI